MNSWKVSSLWNSVSGRLSSGWAFSPDESDENGEILGGQEVSDVPSGELVQDGTFASQAEVDSTLQTAFKDVPGGDGIATALQDSSFARARFLTILAMFSFPINTVRADSLSILAARKTGRQACPNVTISLDGLNSRDNVF
ncbi:MAG: hypothetical protein KOO60_08960 [Gemmatimonadales bacterium]|nr:hypothetical protein [Gemmatimonadales bacterium]